MSVLPGDDGNEFTVTLEGGGPWGFTLQGGADFRSPLKVGKVTPGGKAQGNGLVAGDIILTINGVGTSSMKHYEAQRLIVASRKTLQLVCNKAVIQSPKSSSQLYSFGYPSPPRSTTPEETLEKTKSLGRHARQSSLDLQSFRSRSYSDVKKKAVAGDHIAGIKVPAPPPKVKRKSDPVTLEQRVPRYVAGIRVPAPPPPSVKPVRNKTSPEESPPVSMATTDIPSVSVLTDDTPPDSMNTTETSVSMTTTETSVSMATTETPVSVTNPEVSDIPPISVTAASLESEESSKSSLDQGHAPVVTPIDTTAIDESVSESQFIPSTPESSQLDETSTTSGYKSINSSSEEDILSMSGSGSGSDWYKSMFQSMKKGVEEQIPNKKHVCDRSPTPARKTTFDQNTESLIKVGNDETSVSGVTGRRSSESSLSSTSTKSMARTSSSGTVDAVNSLNSGVVFRKNMQTYNQSRNYWKTIEKQASQERIEIAAAAAKRNSLRRNSSSGSVGRVVSPDILNETGPIADTSYTVFQEEEPTHPHSSGEIAVSVNDHKSSTSPSPPLKTSSPLGRKTPPRTPSPVKTPPPITPPLRTTSPLGFSKTLSPKTPPPTTPPPKSPPPKTPPPKSPPPKTPPPTTPPFRATSPLLNSSPLTSKTPPIVTPPLRTPSPQLILTQELKTPPKTPPLKSVTPPLKPVTPPLKPVTPPLKPVTPPLQPVTPPLQPVTPPLKSVTPPKTPPLKPVTPPVRSPQFDSVDFDETMSKLHPLLKESGAEEKESSSHDDIPQQDLFTRIDPSKLNSALGNAVILGKMEQEGASAALLQSAALAVGQQSQEQPAPRQQKKKSKTTKPPPGEKAKALYDFQSATEKEVSFKKGAIIDLTEQVDANWLKGTVDGQTGIFPISYVKVLTSEEVVQLTTVKASPPPLNLLAKAKYDFTAKSPKELSFNKHDIITLMKQIDDNWYEGILGDNKGIVPVTYIQIFDVEED